MFPLLLLPRRCQSLPGVTVRKGLQKYSLFNLETLLGKGISPQFVDAELLIQDAPDTIEERHCMGKGTPHWVEQFPNSMLWIECQGENHYRTH